MELGAFTHKILENTEKKITASEVSGGQEIEKHSDREFCKDTLNCNSVVSLQNPEEFNISDDLDDLELNRRVENWIKFIFSDERLNAETWNKLSLKERLDALQDFSNQYANKRWSHPSNVADSSNLFLIFPSDTAALVCDTNVFLNKSLLENNTITPEMGVAAIVKSYADGKNISFGGLTKVEKLADRQDNPTSWLEACENLVQLHATLPFSNNLSTLLYNEVVSNKEKYGAVEDGDLFNIPYTKYPDLLAKIGIKATWQDFSHDNLKQALTDNNAVLVCGDTQYLPGYNGESGNHAFVITEYKDGKYFGIDSNFKERTVEWAPRQLEESINGFKGKILVPEKEATWIHKTDTLTEINKELGKIVAADLSNKQTVGDRISFGGSCSHCDNDIKNTKYSWWVCREN